MAKNRNKKKNKSGSMAMDGTSDADNLVTKFSESSAMDTSETASTVSDGGPLRKTQKGRPMKRSKNVRKMKAVVKAISLNEKAEKKISKSESKTLRTKSAKSLYD